jgi:hypothetical protein
MNIFKKEAEPKNGIEKVYEESRGQFESQGFHDVPPQYPGGKREQLFHMGPKEPDVDYQKRQETLKKFSEKLGADQARVIQEEDNNFERLKYDLQRLKNIVKLYETHAEYIEEQWRRAMLEIQSIEQHLVYQEKVKAMRSQIPSEMAAERQEYSEEEGF